MQEETKKTILALVILVVFAALGYYLFFYEPARPLNAEVMPAPAKIFVASEPEMENFVIKQANYSNLKLNVGESLSEEGIRYKVAAGFRDASGFFGKKVSEEGWTFIGGTLGDEKDKKMVLKIAKENDSFFVIIEETGTNESQILLIPILKQ